LCCSLVLVKAAQIVMASVAKKRDNFVDFEKQTALEAIFLILFKYHPGNCLSAYIASQLHPLQS